MGVPAGYSSAFLHKSLKGTDWKKNIVLTNWCAILAQCSAFAHFPA